MDIGTFGVDKTRNARDGAKLLRKQALDSARAPAREFRGDQIEPDNQNRVLHHEMAELEQSRNPFYLLFHQAPVGYLVLDGIGPVSFTHLDVYKRQVEKSVEGRSAVHGYP